MRACPLILDNTFACGYTNMIKEKLLRDTLTRNVSLRISHFSEWGAGCRVGIKYVLDQESEQDFIAQPNFLNYLETDLCIQNKVEADHRDTLLTDNLPKILP